MGWCGGVSIAESVCSLVREHIPTEERQKIASKIVEIFEDEDADTMDEADQLMKDAGRDKDPCDDCRHEGVSCLRCYYSPHRRVHQ
jgi:hypothetical protein